MKKLILTTMSIAAGFGAFAQLPVNQSAENKHAILEEFTGLYCTFCPDGHTIGAGIAASNPNTYHRVHIHAGGFATPGPGDPNMIITEGTAIDNVGNPGGSYPFGGTNRGNGNSWGVGRGSWAGAASTVMAQSSYVNVAMEGNVVESTRQLTVDVEIFYTGAAPTTTQYLTVMVLQNNILGHQTDGGNYNPGGWKCQAEDIYQHQHVLRMVLNSGGVNGESVSTTTGGVVTKQYVLTLPADINGVDLEIGELELVGFVTEGNNLTTPTVSGNDGPINVVLGAGVTIADMTSSDNHLAPAGGLCDNVFTPKMDVTNNSGASITGVDVSYIINGTPTTINLPTQVIAAGATYTHTFATTNLAGGTNTIEYDVSLTDATKWDGTTWNNISCPDAITVIPAAAFATNHQESMESYAYGVENLANSIHDNPLALPSFVLTTAGSGQAFNIGGYGNSLNSWRFRFYSITTGASSLVWEKLDFSATTGNEMTFDHAYAQYTSENDRLQVFISLNCGTTWTSVWNYAGTALATVPAQTAVYYPQAGDWLTNTIDLSAYDGQSEVMIKMEGTSAYGNNLYVDNINMDMATGIDEIALESSISIFPNPTTEVSTISFDLTESALVKMDVYNTMGSMIFSNGTETMNAGTQKVIFDGSNLPNGIYFVNLTIGDKLITKKVSLIK